MPTYATQFYFSFLEAVAEPLGLTAARFRVQFLRDGFSGTAVELLPGGDPVVLKWSADDEAIDAPIWRSEAEFSLAAESFWDVEHFTVTGDREVRAVIERDATGVGTAYQPYWSGWVRAQNLTEDYAAKPYPVTFSAWDGLTGLAEIPLVDRSGKRLQGQIRLSTAIRSSLALTGQDLPLTTSVNIFDLKAIELAATPVFALADADPLYTTAANEEAFVNDDSDTVLAEDALADITEPFAVRTALVNGQWMSLRAPEMGGGYDQANPAGPTIRVRDYATGDATTAPAAARSVDLAAVVSRTGILRAEEGEDYKQGLAFGVKVEQRFGRFISKIPNSDFKAVNGAGFPDGWLKNNVPSTGPLRPYRVGNGTELDPYGMVIFGAGDNRFNSDTPSIYVKIPYAVGSPENLGKISWTLSGEFELKNLRAAKPVVFGFTKNSANLLKADGWKRDPTRKESFPPLQDHYTTVNGVQRTKNGPAKFSIDIPPLPGIINLQILLCIGESLDQPTPGVQPFTIYRKIRLESVFDGINVNGAEVIIQKPGKKIKTTVSLNLGDVPKAARPAERVGSFFTRMSTGADVPTTAWYNVAKTFGVGGQAPAPAPLINIRATDLARQLMQPADIWEGTLTGRLPHAVQTVLYFEDIGVKDGAGIVTAPYPFIITGLETSLRMMANRLTSVRLMQTDPAIALPSPKSNWQTPDGPLPMEPDAETGLPIDPTIPSGKPPLNKVIDAAINTRFPLVLSVTPHVLNSSKLQAGAPTLVLSGLSNGQTTGYVQAKLRKLQSFSFPG